MANTRSGSKRQRPSSSSSSGAVKRTRGRAARIATQPTEDNSQQSDTRRTTTSTSQGQSNSQNQSGHLGPSDPPRAPFDLDFDQLTLTNYERAMEYWPLNRINQKLASQSPENEKLCAVTIAHSQAVLERFEHTLHMIAMIAGCSVAVLKRKLGLMGGTHGENPWHRWLSFSKEAQKHPMPIRGDPQAGEILTFRNRSNAAAYQNLSDDEYSIYTAPIFYALGGYPNYSAINVTDLENINLDEVLVPEVPKLSAERDARYRPLYLESVDLNKVAKDKEFNTPASSSTAIEKRSMQCFKKIASQLARDSPLVGLDYLFIACSKSPLGQGWCRVKTTQDEILCWLNKQTNFEQIFPIYAQGGGTFEQIRKSVTDGKKTAESAPSGSSKGTSKCDKVKLALTAKIRSNLCRVTGKAAKGWPRGMFSVQTLEKREIFVSIRRAQESTLSDDLWLKGYSAMDTAGRAAWLDDYQNDRFEFLPLQPDSLQDGISRTGHKAVGPCLPADGEASGSRSGGGLPADGEASGSRSGGGLPADGEASGSRSGGGLPAGGEASGSGTGAASAGENADPPSPADGQAAVTDILAGGMIDTWV